MAPGSTSKSSSRSNTPHNSNNNNNNSSSSKKNRNSNNKTPTSSTSSRTPRTKGRSQTPSHKHTHTHAHTHAHSLKNQTPTPKQTASSASSFASPSPSQSQSQQQQQQQQLSPQTLLAFNEALEDVHTRFILNLPEEELSSSDRLFFQMEQAWWFYEDFICDEMDDIQNENVNKIKIDYPRFANLKPFAKKLFSISPILAPLLPQFESLYRDFSKYKRKISTYGTILLNKNCTKIVLCQDYNGKAWTLPAGKVNQNEKGVDAAVRETYEETGFDIGCNFGLTKDIALKNFQASANNGNGVNDVEAAAAVAIASPTAPSAVTPSSLTDYVPWTTTLTDDDNNIKNNNNNNNNNNKKNKNNNDDHGKLFYIENDGSGKRRTAYICHGVPEDFPFCPIVRKEVADVQWHSIDDIPKKSFAVLPFMRGLKKWIRKNYNVNNNNNNSAKKTAQEKKRDGNTSTKRAKISSSTPKKNRSGSKHKDRPRSSSASSHASKKSNNGSDDNDNDLVQSGLIKSGEKNRWSEDEMFRTNEELIGRKIEYDGNPQHFATTGFGGIDPHAFRIVGGGLMNSGERDIAEAPDKSKLQPLYRTDDEEHRNGSSDEESGVGNIGDNDDLKPFFGDDGATPWGEKVFDNSNEITKDAAVNEKIENQKVVAAKSSVKGDKTVQTQKKQVAGDTHKILGIKKISTSESANNKDNGTSCTNSSNKSECSSSDITLDSESSIPSAFEFEESLFSGKGAHSHSNNLRNDHQSEKAKESNKNLNENKNESSGLAILTMLRGGGKKDKNKDRMIPAAHSNQSLIDDETENENNHDNDNSALDVFMTDKEITAKSQQEKSREHERKKKKDQNADSNKEAKGVKRNVKPVSESKHENQSEHLSFALNWVKSLPKPPPSKYFGEFKFDYDTIMVAVTKAK